MKKELTVFEAIRRISLASPAINLEGVVNIPDFVYNPANGQICGYTVSENYFNLSLMVRINGYIQLGDDRPAELPDKMNCNVFRNIAIIKEGKLALDKIVIKVDESIDLLKAYGIVEPSAKCQWYRINFQTVFGGLVAKNWESKEAMIARYENLISRYSKIKSLASILAEENKKFIPENTLNFSDEAAAYLKNVGINPYTMTFSPKKQFAKKKSQIEMIVSQKLTACKLANIESEPVLEKMFDTLICDGDLRERVNLESVVKSRLSKVRDELFELRMNLLKCIEHNVSYGKEIVFKIVDKS